MLFAKFLASPWRWVAFGLLIILAIAFGAQGLDYATSWVAHRNMAKQVDATDAARAARQRSEASRSHHFDSTLWAKMARARQYAHETRLQKQLDDSLSNILPAVPVLPQRPARY